MEVGVRVEAEDPMTGRRTHTATSYLTFVSLGADGRPAAVPALTVATDDERRRFAEAELRRAARLAARQALQQARA
jgi:acyl-CoA hydrolase